MGPLVGDHGGQARGGVEAGGYRKQAEERRGEPIRRVEAGEAGGGGEFGEPGVCVEEFENRRDQGADEKEVRSDTHRPTDGGQCRAADRESADRSEQLGSGPMTGR